jgi:hypothetical protein
VRLSRRLVYIPKKALFGIHHTKQLITQMKIEGYCPKYGSPIFSVAWCEVDGKDIILVAAGGGATNSGVLNSIVRSLILACLS